MKKQGLILKAISGVMILTIIGAGVMMTMKNKNISAKENKLTVTEISVDQTYELDNTTETPKVVVRENEPVLSAEEFEDNSPSYSNYKQAYLATIEEHKKEIKAYNWQYGVANIDDQGKGYKTLAPLSLMDVTGDKTPELIMLTADEPDGAYAYLTIFTYTEDGTVKTIFSEIWDVNVAGGTEYMLFRRKGSHSLFAYKKQKSLVSESGIYEFCQKENGQLEKKRVIGFDTDEGPDMSVIYTFTVDGEEVTAEAYKSAEQEIIGSIKELSVYNNTNVFGEETEQKLLFETKRKCCSVDEMKDSLKNK